MRNIIKDKNNSDIWIEGLTQWMCESACNGFMLYYINIMFEPLHGNSSTVLNQMKKAIEKAFYGQLCTRFSRNPRVAREAHKLPRLWLFPDLPCHKRFKKIEVKEMEINCGGLHMNGVIAIPVWGRFKGCLIEEIEQNQRRYAHRGISRIHVARVKEDVRRVSDYTVKSMKTRIGHEDVLILPRTRNEL
jgi:hypothetical protein